MARPSASFSRAGIADDDLRELAAQLEPVAPVARVDLADADRGVEPRRGEARFAASRRWRRASARARRGTRGGR